jgi:hypothetical protein
VGFLLIGLMAFLATLAPDMPWWERVVIALVGVASPLQAGLPVAGPGLRRSGAAPRRLQLVEPGMVWLDFHPGPARHPK